MRVTDRCKDLHNCQARHVLLDEVHVSNVLANELSGSGFASLVETSIIVTAWITSDEVFGRRGLPTDTVKGVVNQREGKARALWNLPSGGTTWARNREAVNHCVWIRKLFGKRIRLVFVTRPPFVLASLRKHRRFAGHCSPQTLPFGTSHYK